MTCDFEKFRDVFRANRAGVARASRSEAHVIETDGDLDESEMNLELARAPHGTGMGTGFFAAYAFSTRFRVEDQRVVGQKHLKLKLSKARNPELKIVTARQKTGTRV